ncbi:MAG: ribosome maturation factor RimP [Myxococcota bacterium]|nr:ribosome maturation factor RimP [Myxococcota bacterium]
MIGNLAAKVHELSAPLLVENGFELVLVEYISGQKILRIYVDREEGGVSLDDCALVSHWVSDLLDVEGISDGVDGRYRLEISSPGLDRPLVKPEHFKRFVGFPTQVKTVQAIEGRKKFSGEIILADGEKIVLSIDGTSHEIPYTLIERARLVPQY